jgi:hypothetical protein
MLDEALLRNEVEPYIDKLYLDKPLLSCHRDSATIHLLRILEDMTRFVTMKPFTPGYQELQFHTRLRWAHEAIPWALRWVWRDCPVAGPASLELDWTLYKEAHDLMDLAFDYYQICRYFVLYSRGFMCAETTKERKRVRFYFRSDPEQYRDAASMIYSVLQDFTPVSAALHKLMTETMPIISTILPHYIDKTGAFSIRCETPPDLMEYFKRWATMFVDEMKFEMPGTWQFGDYSLDQFKSFWKSILAQALAHIQAHEYADDTVGTKGGAIGSLVMQVSEESLSKARALFPIPLTAWRSILSSLIYQPTTDYWDPFWQPIVKTSDGTLLIAPHLITSSSPERNLMTLLTRSAASRTSYDRVSSEKELEQLNGLLQLFQPPRYTPKTRVLVPRGDGTTLTDIDLLLYDKETDVLLLLHAKWFIRPDRVQEQLAREQEVHVALRTATRAAARVTELGEAWISRVLATELNHLPTLHSVVVCRNFVPGGWVHDQHIPVINEEFLAKFVGSPQFTGLASLYAACAGFTKSVEKMDAVELAEREIPFGAYTFEVPTMEFAKN